ncbi:MAG TPA: hypothetical protein VK760_10150 [Candidatus Acidoferrales bacterium]|jgi:hypothetical protein|nr:hypothetical protein [Candidatus Acidoferrales bacterium]
MILRPLTLAVAAVMMLAVAPASVATSFPYTTTIANGDIETARLVYGDQAAVGERDALPAFTDLDAYKFYYKFDDDRNCDDSCVAAAYHTLKGAGRIRLLTVSTKVTVLSKLADPDDPNYEICRVHIPNSSKTWFVLSAGLADGP